jgi:amidase
MMADLTLLSIAEASAGFREGRLTSVELVGSCLNRIARLDDTYQAFITVADDALAQAQAADQALAHGDDRPLLGIPVSLKDLAVTKGLRTTFGSSLFADHIPEQDDLVAERLRAAGAVLIGKTNTPEFGYGAVVENKLRGPTANPFNPKRTSGGSSGGAAVSVSLGMCTAAIGSDFGGSVRLPAAFCGIVGYRPAIGMIPTVPKTHAWQNLIATGTFGRCVADAAVLAEALSGPDMRDPITLRSGSGTGEVDHFEESVRIAYAPGLGFAEIDRSVVDVVDAAMARIGVRHQLGPVENLFTPGFQPAYEILRGALLHDEFAALVAEWGNRLSPTLHWNVSRGRDITAHQLMQAERERSENYQRVAALLESNDIIASAAAPVPAFRNADRELLTINGKPLRNIIDYSAVSLIATMTGFPCISIPCGVSTAGLPVGLQLVARPDRQRALLRFAAHLEAEFGCRSLVPPALS